MTEKEFRKIVFETELPTVKKAEYIKTIDDLIKTLVNNLPEYLNYENYNLLGSLRNSLILPNETNFEVSLNIKLDHDFKDKIIFNELENILLLNNYSILRNEDFINVTLENFNLKIYINKKISDLNITDILNNDYPLFKNTLKILKSVILENNITNLNDDILINILGYSLINHLVDYRYEGYIYAFSKGLDDFLNGLYIDLSDKYYEKYHLTKSFINKTNYTVINFEDGINLTKDFVTNDLNEIRRFKKILQKYISLAEITTGNKDIIIDINPKVNPQTKELNWSYIIDPLNLSLAGGSYNSEQINLLDAMYKALQKALKVIIEKKLTSNKIFIRCKFDFLLKALDDEDVDLTTESKSRLKSILKTIEENHLKISLIK